MAGLDSFELFAFKFMGKLFSKENLGFSFNLLFLEGGVIGEPWFPYSFLTITLISELLNKGV